MLGGIVRLAKLLDDLIVARTVYDLVKMGYNPATLYYILGMLVGTGL